MPAASGKADRSRLDGGGMCEYVWRIKYIRIRV